MNEKISKIREALKFASEQMEDEVSLERALKLTNKALRNLDASVAPEVEKVAVEPEEVEERVEEEIEEAEVEEEDDTAFEVED